MSDIVTLYSKDEFKKKIGKSKCVTVLNTFDYMYEKISKGIFVEISKGKLAHFIFFINKKFRNNWSKILIEKNNLYTEANVKEFIFLSVVKYYYVNFKIQKPIEIYISEWRKKFKWDNYELDVSKWYANNGIFRFDKEKSHSSKNILEIYKFLNHVCEVKSVKNCKFFINTRDSPVLAKNYYEPYFNIFGCKVKLEKMFQTKKTKIFSFSSDQKFYNDLLMPTFLDMSFIDEMNLDWTTKKNQAVFRGSTTGFSSYNQRVKLHKICINKKDEFLDVGFTKIQTRPRIENGILKFIDHDVYPYNGNYLSYKEQSNYKFIIHVAGNVEAFRLSAELASGSCILFVKHNWSIWYTELLIEYIHYIPIKEDFSDFTEKIEWVKTHDLECEQIARNARKFYEDIIKIGLIDHFVNSL